MFLHQFRHRRKYVVSHVVTVGVVDLFEVVDIEDDDGERLPRSLGACDLVIGDLVEFVPVEKPREFVRDRHLFEAIAYMQKVVDKGEEDDD